MDTYTLLDSGGVNPLPPLIFVSIYTASADQTPENLASSGFTLVGGRIELTLAYATDYVAAFSGAQAPRSQLAFTSPASSGDTADFTLHVTNYTSPSLSQDGYGAAIFEQYPKRWLDDSANQPGGIAYPLFQAEGKVFSRVDASLQKAQAAMRLWSCEGDQLVSWAADYLEDFPRYPGETDDHYRDRIVVALRTPNCTLSSIRSKVQAYIDANPAAQQGTVTTFDLRTDPTLSAQVGIVDGDGKFCVVLPVTYDSEFAFFAGQTFVGRDSYVISLDRIAIATNVDPNILAIVDATKMAGRRPVYAQVQV